MTSTCNGINVRQKRIFLSHDKEGIIWDIKARRKSPELKIEMISDDEGDTNIHFYPLSWSKLCKSPAYIHHFSRGLVLFLFCLLSSTTCSIWKWENSQHYLESPGIRNSVVCYRGWWSPNLTSILVNRDVLFIGRGGPLTISPRWV